MPIVFRCWLALLSFLYFCAVKKNSPAQLSCFYAVLFLTTSIVTPPPHQLRVVSQQSWFWTFFLLFIPILLPPPPQVSWRPTSTTFLQLFELRRMSTATVAIDWPLFLRWGGVPFCEFFFFFFFFPPLNFVFFINKKWFFSPPPPHFVHIFFSFLYSISVPIPPPPLVVPKVQVWCPLRPVWPDPWGGDVRQWKWLGGTQGLPRSYGVNCWAHGMGQVPGRAWCQRQPDYW